MTLTTTRTLTTNMGAPRRRIPRREVLSRLITQLVLLLFTVVALMPFASLILVSFYPPDQVSATGLDLPQSIHLQNYARAWVTTDLGTTMLSSAIVAISVVVVGSLLCILAGYAFGTMKFPFQRTLFIVFLIGLLLPFEAVIVPLYYDLRSVGLTNTYLGLILPELALFASFGTFWMRAHFLSTPRSLVEAARLDGASSWTTLWRVLVPSAWPAITTMMVLFFIWSWNEFLLALVLAQAPEVRTAPFSLGLFVGQFSIDTPGLAAAAIIVTLPALVIYVLLQRHFIRGVTSGSVKG